MPKVWVEDWHEWYPMNQEGTEEDADKYGAIQIPISDELLADWRRVLAELDAINEQIDELVEDARQSR